MCTCKNARSRAAPRSRDKKTGPSHRAAFWDLVGAQDPHWGECTLMMKTFFFGGGSATPKLEAIWGTEEVPVIFYLPKRDANWGDWNQA